MMKYFAADIDAKLAQIEHDAANTGVKLRLGRVGRVGVDLLLIQRTAGLPGSGALVMQRLCEFADAHRAEVYVYAAEADPWLMDYYRRFGFEVDDRADDEAKMRRDPNWSCRANHYNEAGEYVRDFCDACRRVPQELSPEEYQRRFFERQAQLERNDRRMR